MLPVLVFGVLVTSSSILAQLLQESGERKRKRRFPDAIEAQPLYPLVFTPEEWAACEDKIGRAVARGYWVKEGVE